MNYTFAQYRESADALQAKLGGFRPKVAMILGSGLGYLGDLVEDAVVVPYGEIPHFKHSTAPGHKGQLVFGRLAGQPVAVMQGRVHHYEGYSYEEVSYGVRVLRLLGCDTLFVTNAAGGVNWKFQAGDLMLITDHIKIFMESPLERPEDPRPSPQGPASRPRGRHVDDPHHHGRRPRGVVGAARAQGQARRLRHPRSHAGRLDESGC